MKVTAKVVQELQLATESYRLVKTAACLLKLVESRKGIPEIVKSDALALLVDDVVDSRWTITVIAALLRQAGSGPVYPVALASTAIGE